MSRIRADRYTNRLGTGAPLFANGVNVTGNVGVGTTVPTSKLSVIGDMNVTGTVSVGGTLTYDDVTNIDSVGIVTARGGLNVGPLTGIAATISSTGDITSSGTLYIASQAQIGRLTKPDVGLIVNNDKDNSSNNATIIVKNFNASGRLWTGTSSANATTSEIYGNGNANFQGTVGIGTDNPERILHASGSGAQYIKVTSTSSANAGIEFGDTADTGIGNIVYANSDDSMFFSVNGTERIRITSGGNMGIGCADPGTMLQVSDSGDDGTFRVGGNNAGETGFNIAYENGGTTYTILKQNYAATNANAYTSIHTGYFTVNTGSSFTERLRIKSSGEVLVNKTTTGSKASNAALHVKSGSGAWGINLSCRSNNDYAYFGFTSADSNESMANVYARRTTTNTGFLSIETNSGNTSATERIRIGSLASSVYISHIDSEISIASGSSADTGVTLCGGNTVKYNIFVSDNGIPMYIGRQNSDGTLLNFAQSGSTEGSISVSGSTVSYNGGHLSRWSQLVGISTNVKSDRPTIYQGTVMSNLDEMCEWPEEVNQQLNKTKVSDSVGDKDVAGVFWTWDDDDDTYTNDFYVAMTGDMVIRIAQGTTVARGDLLMSAGDGTAKPQDDDIVRSKTIAKVTSTTVSATYSDGSYCVPCVLMAC